MIDLCRRVGRTEVVGVTWNNPRPPVEYDGVVSVERIDYTRYASKAARAVSALGARLDSLGPTRRFWERQGRPPATAAPSDLADHHLGALFRFLSAWAFYALLISALHRRARAGPAPTLVVSHDIYALFPAVLAKRRYGARLLHDSHEYFPESDLLAPRWQRMLTRLLERPFIRRADQVVTVSPPLARELERVYGLSHVLAVPNAEPRGPVLEPQRSNDGRVRFLVQGQASPGRGFEGLLDLWSAVARPEALLQIRCPESDYVAELRARAASLVAAGRVEFLPAVPEEELIEAASRADVGVIPYVGPSLNHVFACPNKLSQYMQAGLPVLANGDLDYVTEVISSYDCGVSYRSGEPDAFAAIVDALTTDASERARLGENGRHAAATEYNWETLAEPYLHALQELAR